MLIKLSPQRRDDTLVVEKTGDVLTLNGVVFDFSSLPDGATLPQAACNSLWLDGDVSRVNGELQLTLLLPLGPTPSPAQCFPVDLVNPPDGPVQFPTEEDEA